MPGADPSIGWATYFIALAVIVASSFLVTYLATDLGRMPLLAVWQGGSALGWTGTLPGKLGVGRWRWVPAWMHHLFGFRWVDREIRRHQKSVEQRASPPVR